MNSPPGKFVHILFNILTWGICLLLQHNLHNLSIPFVYNHKNHDSLIFFHQFTLSGKPDGLYKHIFVQSAYIFRFD